MRLAVIISLMTVFSIAHAAVNTNSTVVVPANSKMLDDEISDDEDFENDLDEDIVLNKEDIQFLNADENKLIAYANLLKRQAIAEIDLFGSIQEEIMDELENIREDIEFNAEDEEFLKASLEPSPQKVKLEAKAPTTSQKNKQQIPL